MVSAFSIGTSKRTDFSKQQTPGPGTYQPDKQHKEAPPSWKMGQEERKEWYISKSPGPGHYNPVLESNSKKEKAPSYQFGLKTITKEVEKERIPGPGAYNPKDSQLQQPPSYSLRPKTTYMDHLTQKKAKDPGPGMYETNYSTIINQPSTKIAKSFRSTFNVRSASPGPGQYMPIDYKPDQAKYVFGSEERSKYLQQPPSTYKFQQLGPGTYNQKSSLRQNIGPQLTPRREEYSPSSMKTPGPGTYEQNPKAIKPSDPMYKIGSQKQRITFDSKGNQIGPGQYSPKFGLARKEAPKFGIGTSQRVNFSQMISKTPGPGTYEATQKIVEGPQHSMVPRREDKFAKKEAMSKPSPNKYDVNLSLVKEAHSVIRIGTGQKLEKISRSLSPGPGRYQESSKIVEGPQYSFGKERRGVIKTNKVPGPGFYDMKPTFADVPKYLIPDENSKKIKLDP